MKRIKSRSTVVEIGDAVQVPLVQQELSKVVNINNTFGICQVAMKMGVLRPWYVYHKLYMVTGAGNNQVLMDIENAFQGWRMMKIIAPRMAAMNESIVGGQNFLCKCKGKCISNVCLCYKNSRTCMSTCHWNSKCCENYDQQKLDDKNKKQDNGQTNERRPNVREKRERQRKTHTTPSTQTNKQNR